MALLDRQKRAAEIGVIRIGTSKPNNAGTGRTPVKLDRLRFTSRSETAIRAIAEAYGGTAREWADGAPTPGQWEVITTAREIPVAVPPGALVVDAWYELWVKGVRERKCDGQTEQLGDRPCVCPLGKRACKPHTRLRVILPDIPGGGTWRLNTSGENAADELAGVADTMAQYAQRGQVLPAVLRLEQRVTLTKEGTRRYVVPKLELTQSFRELVELPAGHVGLPPAPVRAIEAAPSAAAPVAVEAPALPAATPAPSGAPERPQDVVPYVEKCGDLKSLQSMAKQCRSLEWMDEFVTTKYAPSDDEQIELIEVFRARQAELESPA